jgi:hypothetical protein
MQGFQRVFSRGVVTRDDAALLLGVARQAAWAAKNAVGRGVDTENGAVVK